MPDEFTKLAEMLAVRDSVVSYLNNLENLKNTGTISSEQYSSLKSEYGQRLGQVDSDISKSKSELQNLIAIRRVEIDQHKFELSKLETKLKVGEISQDMYRSSENSVKQTISGLEQYIDYVSRYIKANSSEELRLLFSKPAGAGVSQTAKAPSNTQNKPEIKQSPKRNNKLIGILLGVGGGVIVLIAVVAVILLLGRGRGQVQIPVEITGATNLGALHMELTYDPQSLIAVSVNSGQVGKDAILEYNLETPGKVIIGLVSVPGINQNGILTSDLLIVAFKVQKEATSTDLNIENISAYDADTLSAIAAEGVAGRFSADDKSFISPMIDCSRRVY